MTKHQFKNSSAAITAAAFLTLGCARTSSSKEDVPRIQVDSSKPSMHESPNLPGAKKNVSAGVSGEINNLILELSTKESGIPYAIRAQMLKGARVTNVIGLNGKSEQRVQMDFKDEGVSMHLSVRSLNVKSDNTKIYLLKEATDIRDCTTLRKYISPKDGLKEHICYEDELGQTHTNSFAESMYGFAAYRFSDSKKAENVTSTIFPPDPTQKLLETERYETHNELSSDEKPSSQVDSSRLAEVPALRLYLELSEAGGLPRAHPRAFSGGYSEAIVHTAHFGFLVWNGTRFELREKVPRALWPCTHDSDFSPSGLSCSPRDPDPFITD